MPILQRLSDAFHFRVTSNVLDYFHTHKIKSSPSLDKPRWKLGDVLTAALDLEIQPHIVQFNGMVMPALGSFSYSFSQLPCFMKIGRYCSIAKNVRHMGPQHAVNFVSNSDMLYRPGNLLRESIAEFGEGWTYYPHDQGGYARIGNDVWVGQDVLLGPKADLGDGCVVGAGAVVTGRVPPYAIVGGVPAKLIRYRFAPDIVRAMLDLRWWDYALPHLSHLPLDRPEAFIEGMRKAVERGEVQPFRPALGLAVDVFDALG
jgi:acetyltransferase-like isoleucine patch superfamily enzyme